MQSNCEAVDHYAANNPVKYTDPDGKWVRNNTDEYILIRTESTGYVILAPYSYYDGRNVLKKDGTCYDGIVDAGKIDGVIFSNGTIFKFSDHKYLKKKIVIGGLVLLRIVGVVGNYSLISNIYHVSKSFPDDIQINVTITKKDIEFGYNLDSPSQFFNNALDFAKNFTGDEKSGKYTVGNETAVGRWVSGNISQEKLKTLANGATCRLVDSSDLEE